MNSTPESPKKGETDLEALWSQWMDKLGLGRGSESGQPQKPNLAIAVGVVLGLLLAFWVGTGLFIVHEGQQAVISRMGQFHALAGPGLQWHLPYPMERHDVITVKPQQPLLLGNAARANGTADSKTAPESFVLTHDQALLDVNVAVSYQVRDVRAAWVQQQSPALEVERVAQTAIRAVVGAMPLNDLLSTQREQLPVRIQAAMNSILERYASGIEVTKVAWHEAGIRPPSSVQAVFNDVEKAEQERQRLKAQAQTYADEVTTRAAVAASRVQDDAKAYAARVVAQAEGDVARFDAIFAEYQKAPQVMRDRMYLETMEQIYNKVTKIVVDSGQAGNTLHVPLDKLLPGLAPATAATPLHPEVPAPAAATVPDTRSRDAQRTREREAR